MIQIGFEGICSIATSIAKLILSIFALGNLSKKETQVAIAESLFCLNQINLNESIELKVYH